MKRTYDVEIDCANCANLMEDATKKTDGVIDATVNFMTQKMTVTFEDEHKIDETLENIIKNCKKIDDDFEIHI